MISPSSISFFSAARAEDLPMFGQRATTSAPVNFPTFSSVYFLTISYAVLLFPVSDNMRTKNFNDLSKYNQPIMPGLVIDNTDKIRPINDLAYSFPVSLIGV